MKKILLTTLSLFALTAPALAQNPPPTTDGTITMIGNSGQTIGTATLRQAQQGVVVEIALQGLISGWHAVQLHAIGDCSDTAAFEVSGPIIALKGQRHGFLNTGGPMDGDLPNIWIGQDGTGKAQFYDNLASAQELMGPSGSSIVVRSIADDMRSEPDGQSGTRVGCGIVSPQKAVVAPVATPLNAVQSPPRVSN